MIRGGRRGVGRVVLVDGERKSLRARFGVSQEPSIGGMLRGYRRSLRVVLRGQRPSHGSESAVSNGDERGGFHAIWI